MDKPTKPNQPNTQDIYSNIFTLKNLIAMPLKAVINANAMAAKTAISIIQEYGFEVNKDGSFGKIRMAQFTYNYIGKNGAVEEMEISIPYITLIPLPLLEVKQANFEFALQILDQVKQDKTANLTPGAGLVNKTDLLQAILTPVNHKSKKSKSGSSSSSRSLRANMNVKINMGQSDLPNGILQLMNIGQEATSGRTVQQTIEYQPTQLIFSHRSNGLALTLMVNATTQEDITRIYTIEVTSETGIVHEMFDANIVVKQGNLIGNSDKASIRVMPEVQQPLQEDEGHKGRIKLIFSANNNSNNNGFITIKASNTKSLNVYFKIIKRIF